MAKTGKNKRLDGKTNEQIIISAYMKYIQENESVPPAKQLSAMTGIPLQTIYNHLPNIDIQDVYPAFKSQSIQILEALAKKAKKGETQAIKLWFEVVEKWTPTSNVNINVKPKEWLNED